MRLATFEVATAVGRFRRFGVLADGRLVDATAAMAFLRERACPPEEADRLAQAEVPPDLPRVLASGRRGLDLVRAATDCALSSGRQETALGRKLCYQLAEVRLLAPVPRPPGIACFAAWESHIADSAAKGFTVAFPKEGSSLRGYYKGNPDSVAGPGDPILWPTYTSDLDVECELAAVVGQKTKDASPEEARAAIAGYCIFNDVSARDIQREEMALGLGPTKGKDMDGGNILGPYLVTADELGNPMNLRMALVVNGEELSSGNTRQMKWDFGDLLSYLSRGQTVYPGHVLTSGCYPGGSALDLGRHIRPGDEIELRIEGLGALRNPVLRPGHEVP